MNLTQFKLLELWLYNSSFILNPVTPGQYLGAWNRRWQLVPQYSGWDSKTAHSLYNFFGRYVSKREMTAHSEGSKFYFCYYRFTANPYSISHLQSTLTTWWLDSDDVVKIVNCPQHSDFTVDQLCSHRVARMQLSRVTTLSLFSHRVVNVLHRWLMKQELCCVVNFVYVVYGVSMIHLIFPL